MKKIFVLDTNILIGTAGDVLTSLVSTDNDIVICHVTLDELDKHKGDPGEKGYSVREAIRKIYALGDTENGNYRLGIRTEGGGTFYIMPPPSDYEVQTFPSYFDKEKNDVKILRTAYSLLGSEEDTPVILITNDAGMTIDAEIAGLSVQSYRKETVEADALYTGRVDLQASGDLLSRLFKDEMVFLSEINKEDIDIPVDTLCPNEFVTLIDGAIHLPCYVDSECTALYRLPEKEKAFGDIRGRNLGQRFALHALLAPAEEIPLVILRGGAGCGKTFLSLAAGLSKVYDDRKYSEYDKVIITRNNALAGGEKEDLGFLPGDISDKMGPLLAPFYDNLKTILRGDSHEDAEQIKIQAEDLISSDLVEIAPFAYLRGRSIPDSFMIIDEAQNLTVNQVRTAVTRAAKGTKMVFCGDIGQIDAPHLDRRTNGLSYLSEKFKGSPLCAQVTLKDTECIRSLLSVEAVRRL